MYPFLSWGRPYWLPASGAHRFLSSKYIGKNIYSPQRQTTLTSPSIHSLQVILLSITMQAPPAPPSFNTPPERPGHEDLRELYPAPSDAEAVDDHAPPSSTRTPPNSPGVEILREKFIKTKAKSPVKKATLELGDLAAPKACEDNDRTPFISRGELKDLLVAVLADLKSNPSAAQSTKDTGTNPADSEEDKEKEKDTRVRASRREYKVVNEV